MGAPNVVRGKSHSGNISASDLVAAGLLDILSSDYVPFALLQAVFILPQRLEEVSLPQALATVTKNPALPADVSPVVIDNSSSIGIGVTAFVMALRKLAEE